MSIDIKSCLFCLEEANDGIKIFGQIGKTLNVWEIIVKYFWFDLLNDVNSTETYVCSDCWEKVKSFHEFYRMVEAIHNKCPSEIGEEEKPDTFDDKNGEHLKEKVVELDEVDQPAEKVVGLEIDVLDHRIITGGDTNSNERKEESHYDDSTSYQELELEIESQSIETEVNLELGTGLERELQAEHVNTVTQNRLRTVKIHEILPLQCEENVPIMRKRRRSTSLERHIEQIVCYMCHESFSTSEALREHFLLHDREQNHQFVCQTCDKKFNNENILRKHIDGHNRQKRNEKNYQNTICPICEEVMQFGALKSHLQIVHNNVPQKKEKFVCKICAKFYTDSTAFTKHTWTHLNENLTRVQCDVCQKWLKNQYILRIHKQSHQEKIELKCPHCEKIKFSTISLKAHITTAHSSRKHQCTICNKSFKRPITLKEHMSIHTGHSLYNCSYCSKPFKSNGNMYKHMKEVHTMQWNIDRAMKRQKS